MTELEVLEVALWVFSGGFVIKSLTFAFLVWTMRGQRDRTSLGNALRSHYISLAAQAVGLALIFAYYASVVSGRGSWLDQQQRIAMYVIDTVLVLWALERGVNLIRVYLRESRNGTPDPPPPIQTVSGINPRDTKYKFNN